MGDYYYYSYYDYSYYPVGLEIYGKKIIVINFQYYYSYYSYYTYYGTF